MSQVNTERKRFAKWRIDLAIHEAIAIARKRSLDQSFQHLLDVVVSRSNLLRHCCCDGNVGWSNAERFLPALLAVSAFSKNWLRDPIQWIPSNTNPLMQFGSLARHLLAAQSIPNFMTLVWLEAPSPKSRKHQKLFKHLGLGNSIRGANGPIRLTKPMAQAFQHAPDHFTVDEALRWSQVIGMGGREQLAAKIVATRLGSTFERELYWEQVLRYLIGQPNLELNQVGPIIDFMHVQRDGFIRRRSRRATSQDYGALLKKVKKWMERHPDYTTPKLRWPRAAISGFHFAEPQSHPWSARLWTIRELTDSRELFEEGRALHHCVGGYARACASLTSSIWSMQRHGSLSGQRVLTIEVEPRRRLIVTALGKCNTPPKQEARRVMKMWARREGLGIARWV